MSKIVLKSRPNDYWKIGEHESWFTDMAASGLHLKKISLKSAKFEKGEPKDTKYRIDVTRDRVTKEQENIYKESGWDFVTSYGKFSVFSSPVARNAPELHTDPAEQSYTLIALDKQLHITTMILSICMVFFLGMMFIVFFHNSTPILNMVEGPILQQFIIVLVELYVFYTSLRASHSIRTLKKSLLMGKPIDHRANWRKNLWRSNAFGGVIITIACISVVIPFLTIIKGESFTLPEGETNLPIVMLAEIEDHDNMVRRSGSEIDGVDWSNRYSYDWSVFATIQYETDEHGTVPDQMWKDGSGVYSPSIHSQYYKLTIPEMASGLIKDLIKRYIWEESGEVQTISDSEFDELYIAEKDESKQIFASKDGNVIYINYFGYADRNKLIDLAEQKMEIEGK